MANINAPFGFQPIGSLVGAAWSGKTNVYYIPAADTSQLSIGDPVKVVAYNGTTVLSGDANGVPQVVKATGTDTMRGVVTGFLLTNPNNINLQGTILDNTIVNLPATKTRDYYAVVSDDPNTLYVVQGDGTATNQIVNSCNLNASFTVANPTLPAMRSQSVLNSASFLAANTLNWRIMGLYQDANNGFGAYARWIVRMNLHDAAAGTVGA